MGFVKTQDDVYAIEGLLRETRYVVDQLAIGFETTATFVRSVLPPCLEPPDKPSGMVAITRGQSSFCGEYDLAWVGINARAGSVDGIYTLSMLVDGDTSDLPIVAGREIWGEVKKHARVRYSRDHNFVRGYAERHGTRVVELEAELAPDELGPRTLRYSTFDIKATPSADGVGLQHVPLLVRLDVEENDDSVRRGPGRLVLRGTPSDPLDEIPVVKTGRAVYAVGESIFRTGEARELDDGVDYRPYLYGRAYDDFLSFPRPQRYAAILSQ